MRHKKVYLFLLFVVIAFTGAIFARGTTRHLALYMNQKQLGMRCYASRDGDCLYVNLSALRTILHVSTSWGHTDDQLYFKFGRAHFTFFANSREYSEYLTERKKSTMSAPLMIKEGELWMPLEFLEHLGVKVEKVAENEIWLTWNDNYLIGLDVTTYQGRTAYLLSGTQKLQLRGYGLTQPDRFICELADIKTHGMLFRELREDGPLVKQIRIIDKEGEKIQLVFDLTKQSGMRIVQEPGKPETAWVIPGYELENVMIAPDPDRVLVLQTSAPADFQYQVNRKSGKLQITLKDASWQHEEKQWSGDGKELGKVEIYSENDTVTLSMDLVHPENYRIFRDAENPKRLEVRKLTRITGVVWTKTPKGGDLTLTGDGELTVRTASGNSPRETRILLEGATISKNMMPWDGERSGNKTLSIKKVSPDTAEIKVVFECLNGYDLEISPDRRKVTYHFLTSPLVGKTILIDPGHGGLDYSACGQQDTWEKEVNLATALRLQVLLKAAGAKVIMTRSDDTFVDLYERTQLANYEAVDSFICIHANYGADPAMHGMDVYHFPNNQAGQRLAQKIYTRLKEATPVLGQGVKSDNFAVLRETNMPSSLIELGFLSNYQEEALLGTPEFQADAAFGIFQGIVDYYEDELR